MKVVALAGGVGGAKMADGLAQILGSDLTVVVNTGDDFEHFGLKICPDIDTVCYTLGGIANPETGWGRQDETWNALGAIRHLGGPDWFSIGDRDLGTHLERTRRLRDGQSLSEITRLFCDRWDIRPTILPMSDTPTPTIVLTEKGALPFQEYFVKQKCLPGVRGFRYEGIEEAQPSPGVLEAIRDASLIIICPSNPWVSIDPILAIKGIRPVLLEKFLVAVTPIVGGKAIKGPVGKMFTEMGYESTALAVAKHYGNLVNVFVLDRLDQKYESEIKALGINVLVSQTIMKTPDDRRKLAVEIITHSTQKRSDTIERKDV